MRRMTSIAFCIALVGCPDTVRLAGGKESDASSGAAVTSAGSGSPPACEADVANDPKNCGRCGRDCRGGTCSAGRCGAVALWHGAGPGEIAVDDVRLYWTVYTLTNSAADCCGGLLGMAKTGGAPAVLWDNKFSVPVFAIDATHLLVSNGWTLSVLPKSGGVGVDVHKSDVGQMFTIAVDAARAFYSVEFGGWDEVGSVRLDGSGAILYAQGAGAGALGAIDADSIYWTVGNGGGPTARTILRTLKLGGAAHVVVDSAGAPFGAMKVAGDDVYWVGADAIGDNTAVFRAPRNGGAATQLTPMYPLSSGGSMAVDDAYVYWTDGYPGKGQVRRVPFAGGEVEVIATYQQRPAGIAVDETAVYWTVGGTSVAAADGAVMTWVK